MPIIFVLDERDFDAEESAKSLGSDQFSLRPVGKDAPCPHHDDPLDFGQDVGKVVSDHEDAGTLLRNAAQGIAELALGSDVEGVRWLVEKEHLWLVDKSARNHNAALFARGHIPNLALCQMRRLHQVESGARAFAHLRRYVEVGPEGGGGKEPGRHSVQAGGDGSALAG